MRLGLVAVGWEGVLLLYCEPRLQGLDDSKGFVHRVGTKNCFKNKYINKKKINKNT